MELYILDKLLKRTAVVDLFESLIWTERRTAFGDFDLRIISTPETRGQFVTDVKLATNTSTRVMTVETVEDTTDEEGRQILKVKGRSLEAMLEDRALVIPMEPGIALEDYPAEIMRWIFDTYCGDRPDNPDRIPFVTTGNLYPPDNLPEPDPVVWESEPKSVYDALKELADLYDLGFRITRDYDTSKLYFNVYAGSDRTNLQSVLPAVIFSPDLENMKSTTELTTIEKSKNVAYVNSTQGFEIVLADGLDPDTEGFERRVLLVKADDLPDTEEDDGAGGTISVPPTPEEISAHLIAVGKAELKKTRPWSVFDGELVSQNSYKYDVDYMLGDLVTIQKADGTMSSMRITEQIFVHDREGERSYPTLAVDKFIEPGWWISWQYNKFWVDFGPTEYWADQP